MEKQHGAERPFIHWSLSIEKATKIYEKKPTVLNTVKHNLKRQFLDNLAGSKDWLEMDSLAIYFFIYLLTYFSLSHLFNFYSTYLPFPLPPLTICFILLIMYPFWSSITS